MTRRLVVIALVCLGGATARASDDCPDDSRADAQTRRVDAKRFFDLATKAQAAANEAEALRAYQCSFSIVSHPFTAYNVARLADKRGLTDTAISAYRLYLELSPQAPDRAQVTARIAFLREHTTTATKPEKARPEVTAIPEMALEPPRRLDPPAPAERNGKLVTGRILTGAGAVVLAAGAALNLMARDEMTTCRGRYYESAVNPDALFDAYEACDAARPLAYGSYAAFGVGAAAAIAGVTLWTLGTREESAQRRQRLLTWVVPTSGGALVGARLGF